MTLFKILFDFVKPFWLSIFVAKVQCKINRKHVENSTLILLISFMLNCGNLNAQTNTLTAKIVDAETNEFLAGANIYLEPDKRGSISDSGGMIMLSGIKNENIKIFASYVGYADTIYTLSLSQIKDQNLVLKLRPLSEQIDPVIITATRTSKAINTIPVRAESINAKDYQLRANSNIDDLLGSTAGVVVNRSWGIFSKNTSVTMRGLEGAARTLILLNGVPMNKLAGGPVNWHLINPE